MTPKNLFNIILKIFGIFFLKELVNTLPELVSTLIYITKGATTAEMVWALVFTAMLVAFYILVIYQLLFRTNYFVEKFKLDRGFDREEFSFNISKSQVLSIALLVTATVIMFNEIPNIGRLIFNYIEEKRLTNGMTKPDASYIVISGAKIIIALLLIGERTRIVEFIEEREKGKKSE